MSIVESMTKDETVAKFRREHPDNEILAVWSRILTSEHKKMWVILYRLR